MNRVRRIQAGRSDGLPRQPDELGAPNAVLRIEADYVPALAGLNEGDEIVVATWLHLADRDTLTAHPRNDGRRARVAVFATRSPDRPNPIGLHRTTITGVTPPIVAIANFEAVEATRSSTSNRSSALNLGDEDVSAGSRTSRLALPLRCVIRHVHRIRH